MDDRTVGVLGGGQLGRMMIEASKSLGIKVAVLDPAGSSSPAGQICSVTLEGSFNDPEKISDLAKVSDVVTVEIEHVNADALEALENSGVVVNPSSATIRTIQDKYAQKQHLAAIGIPVPEFAEISSIEDCKSVGELFGYPFMLKKKRLAYDGNGNYVIHNSSEVEQGFRKLGGSELYAEKWVSFVKEIAVMVARSAQGTVSYPVVETIQKDNICHVVIAPAQISPNAAADLSSIASKAISSLSGYGIFGVELFLLPDDTVLLNEIAPRPHNSGHYTMEACDISQFEMHLRCILGLPCPSPVMVIGAAVMVNVLGGDSMEDTKRVMKAALGIGRTGVHWYGKNESRKGRKMGHITLTADSLSDLKAAVETLGIDAGAIGIPSRGPRVGIIMGSDSDLATMKDAAEILDHFGVSYELTIVSAHRTPNRMYSYAHSAVERGLQVIIAGAGGAAHLPGMVAALTSLPVVGVPVKSSALSGNDSLLSIVQMPKGIPVATVAIGNAANAGLLAVRILAGAGDKAMLAKMDQYLLNQEDEVLRKADKLEAMGYKKYLGDHSSEGR